MTIVQVQYEYDIIKEDEARKHVNAQKTDMEKYLHNEDMRRGLNDYEIGTRAQFKLNHENVNQS